MLPKAEADIEDILGYLSEFGDTVAKRQHERILKKLRSLQHFPLRGHPVGLLGAKALRQVNINRYKIIFFVNEQEEYVEVQRIVHMKQDTKFER